MTVDPKSSYYDEGGIETIEIIKAKLTKEQFKGFLMGNMLKYQCRLNFKGFPERDCEKINVYAAMLRDELDGREEKAGDPAGV